MLAGRRSRAALPGAPGLEEEHVDAKVLDLPEEPDAVELVRRVRECDAAVPLVVLFESASPALRAAVLDAGADDAIVTPIAPVELGARVRAVLRRAGADEAGTVLHVADLELDLVSRCARRAGRAFALTRIEFDLLELFLRNPDRVLSRAAIFRQVWGYEIEFSSNSLEVYVAALRRKTEAGGRPRVLRTVRGVGYVLQTGG